MNRSLLGLLLILTALGFETAAFATWSVPLANTGTAAAMMAAWVLLQRRR